MIRIAYSPAFSHPLPPGHRFPMEKYELQPQQLLYEGLFTADNFFLPEPMEEEVILLTHDKAYYDRLHEGGMTYREMRAIGFPYSPALIEREKLIMWGTVQASLFALDYGVAFNIAGGTHHAFRDRGEGFCIFNDLAVAANYLLHTGRARKILIIDLDVHQGNGTAALFEGDERVFTFSMHGGNNYPLHKERSDLDIPLPDGTTDAVYLDILGRTLLLLIEQQKPDFIFYQSGVDILASDKLGRMAVSMQGIRERDRMVLSLAARHGIPLTAAMGGGYSTRIAEIVEAHMNVYRIAAELYE